jgi:hypothetical protein
MSKEFVSVVGKFNAQLWLATYIRMLTDDEGATTAAAYASVYKWLQEDVVFQRLTSEEHGKVMQELQLHVQAMREILDA